MQAQAQQFNPDDTTRIFLPSIASLPRQTVLIVDDDTLTRERLTALVQAAGFDTVCASSGREALALLHREYCPIVVSDWLMPDMDGLELCRAVRADSFQGYVYILLLTARDAQQDILSGLDAGADDYLSKRVTEAELIARLRTARRIVALEQSLRDIIEEKRKLATTDALTGTNNRHYFVKHLGRELKRVQRYGGPLSILALDIDRFKSINDRFGHAVGDEVLIEFVRRINLGLPREIDWCARLGGEEFAVVLPQTDLGGAKTVAEKLREMISNVAMLTASGPVSVTVSIGVAAMSSVPRDKTASVDVLLELADRALYASKQAGRDCVTAAPPAKD
ncbi:MAG TPA: diguanylate cyclase [Steroidobacteraceae bacterium]|nr:diguanylate cyclase [Steroidobacteraceae bacterium]